MGLVYTTIQHTFRKQNKLSCNEYVLADMIYCLSTSPESKILGWCFMSRVKIGEELGLSKQSVLNLIEGLVTKGFVDKNPETSFLRTTKKWNKVYFSGGKESLPGGSKDTLPGPGKESLPDGGKDSLPYNNSLDNNKGDNTFPLLTDVNNGPSSAEPGNGSGKAKAPPVPGAPPGKDLYGLFIEKYWDWFKDRNDGIPPKIDGAGGKAAKALIHYFKTIVKARAERDKRKVEDLELDVLISWVLVLDNWHVLEPWLQDKTKLMEINSNIQNILIQIKNNGTVKRNQQTTAKASTNGIINAINNRFNGSGPG